MRRKIATVLLALYLFSLSAVVNASEGAKVFLSEQAVQQGETTEVAVRISGNPGLAAWMFELNWDTAALPLENEAKVAQAGPAFSNGILVGRKTDTGITVLWASTDDKSEDGVLFRFRVKAIGDAKTYPIAITCSEKNTVDVSGASVPVVTETGSITIKGDEKTPSNPPAATTGGGSRPASGNIPAKEDTPLVNPFADVVEGAYYYEPVLWAMKRNITAGTSATTFEPNAVCTRAQTVTFLWRAAGSPEPEASESPFSDVPSDSYYYKAVLWAAEKGITSGTSGSTFSPDATVSRAQVVTFLWRSAGGEKSEGGTAFADVPQGQYYSDAVKWASVKGVTGGTSETTFSPLNDCSRGQIVTFLFRQYG